MPVLTLDQIESLCADALKRAGASDEQAAIVAEELMDAEAEGIRNVGLGYLHLYLKHLRCGKVNPDADPKIVKRSEATTVVDADFGFCHHAYLIAEQRLIETTRAQGVGLMSIHQSSSAGVRGWFVRRLAREGLASLMFANSSRAVAAHGGKVPFFGTNPFAMGAPRGTEEPLVIDMATASTTFISGVVRPENISPRRVFKLVPVQANSRRSKRSMLANVVSSHRPAVRNTRDITDRKYAQLSMP